MWKIVLLALVACVNGQIQSFPTFPVNPVPNVPAPNPQRPNTNNPAPDLSWPQQPPATSAPVVIQPPVRPQPPLSPNWPQPTQAPQQPRPPVILPPRPSPPNSNNTPRWRAGSPDSRCPIPDGEYPTFLADTTNCRQFFMCSGGIAWTMKCPPSVTGNVIWNQRENACQEVEEARC